MLAYLASTKNTSRGVSTLLVPWLVRRQGLPKAEIICWWDSNRSRRGLQQREMQVRRILAEETRKRERGAERKRKTIEKRHKQQASRLFRQDFWPDSLNQVRPFLGVYSGQSPDAWWVKINRTGQYFGPFATLEKAARCHDIAAIHVMGDQASLNYEDSAPLYVALVEEVELLGNRDEDSVLRRLFQRCIEPS